MSNRSSSIAVAILALFLISCSDGLPSEFPTPPFSLKSPITGEVTTQDSITSKPAILYWFTSW